jgi:hypothetical protein
MLTSEFIKSPIPWFKLWKKLLDITVAVDWFLMEKNEL